MTSELQEIAITEEKPLLPGQWVCVYLNGRDLPLLYSQVHTIETPHGDLHITLHGAVNTRRPAILTYHDVGMESKSCFSTLFNFEEMQEIVKNFTVIHIDAPGQEEEAATYPAGVSAYVTHNPWPFSYALSFRTVIAMGVGAGAYVLSKFALDSPDSVEGLVLINIDPDARGWMDWAAQKFTTLTSSFTEQILGHLFSQEELSTNTEVQRQRERLSKSTNLPNVELFWKGYNRYTHTHICPVMLVVGDQAPHEDAVVECNSRLDPTTTSFLKMADGGGLPQISQPSKLTEAFKYFIQGMGYMASSCMTRLSRSRTASLSSSYSIDGSRSRSRTLSQSSQGGQMPPSPTQTMEVSC
uniref:NDRG family member 2 n=1 Tax=Paramormyrops kingsleyae TaxID=1676925 RepID=A0A3B3QKD4_9TELE